MIDINDVVGIQGDLFFIRVKEIPNSAKKKANKIILEGETTGHMHRLTEGEVYQDGERLYLETVVPSTIIHEEHDPIPVEAPGKIRAVRQREYTNNNATKLAVD